ncbi:tellurite resistance/C4-dicarboxylate transporter family protein [Mycobacterium sp. 852002-40037_SCH5390672]|uniref:tellurite resistance/C4-dicarboxylate transporter family protein n=1 Tax=Mycobacterium sp. 852002-40037_SCH5390672 TaxID=1834089 RepID=UPI000804E548|nr:tellurite resistance/C4-dicarboxylate transporter family protein [Mycobacterium sp. 852002-40037_SCH5390672]OBB99227.1 C4-dicarboxylate ABC transporter [Mycobacterium sp. 852002-40037_SCH5390672]
MAIRLSEGKLSPDVFAAVMATGILSTAARDHGYSGLSCGLILLAALGLVILVVLTFILGAAKHRILPWGMRDPEVTLPLFTFVAGCAMLGNRLSSVSPLVLPTVGAIAGVAWLCLALFSARNLSGRHLVALRDQVHGAWLLSSVAASGLTIIAAKLANNTSRREWLIVAVAIWVVALALYLVMTALMVWRAVAERLDRDGFEPDTWILMGSLAIAVVAGHHIHQQLRDGLATIVLAIMVTAWGVATLWIPPLIFFVLHRVEKRPRLLRFTGAWWTLVFPLGMYSAATSIMASEIQVPALQTVALVFFWDALAVWCVVVVAGLLNIPRAASAVTTGQ